ncbi:MAG: ribosome biogenesis GTPase Der [Alphaproteobacteria bacterium]|nr:ribosome biogenesis GTPase Der [Alphaproteobacteria bacterium]MCL2505268.1 ribosome biogenesis GTPase Der [Alphaproteobacteria bacterium]
MTLTVAIAGKPNVGKSTLFNRLIGKKVALVDDAPGVTRDYKEAEGMLFNLSLRVIDTAGLEFSSDKNSISSRVLSKTKQALESADAVLFVVDARSPLTQQDIDIAKELRKTGLPIVLIANKCEGTHLPEHYDEALQLGFGEPLPVSASHGEGMIGLFEKLSEIRFEEKAEVSKKEEETECDNEIRNIQKDKNLIMAIIGRPNAGKSTLVNKLLGQERQLTGEEPGLTRDSVPIAWEYKGTPIRLVDTAGVRRRSRVKNDLEKMMVHETMRAVRLAHVVVLVLDAESPLDKQDLTLARHVVSEGRVLVAALNKWDLIKNKDKTLDDIQHEVRTNLAQAGGVALIPISAKSGAGIGKLMEAAMSCFVKWNVRVSTGKLNKWLEAMTETNPPPIVKGRRIKLRYMTQLKSRPPTFAIWANKPEDLPESYIRFLTRGLRSKFDIDGVPVRILLKKNENPYK